LPLKKCGFSLDPDRGKIPGSGSVKNKSGSARLLLETFMRPWPVPARDLHSTTMRSAFAFLADKRHDRPKLRLCVTNILLFASGKKHKDII